MNAATPTPGAALVTGAGRRLGLAIADGLAAGGWAVAYHHGRSAEGAGPNKRSAEKAAAARLLHKLRNDGESDGD